MPTREYPEIGILLEWDEMTETMSYVQTVAATGLAREAVYGFLQRVQDFLSLELGMAWEDEALFERHRRLQDQPSLALVWRSSWPSGVRGPAGTIQVVLEHLAGRPSTKELDSERSAGAQASWQGFPRVEGWK